MGVPSQLPRIVTWGFVPIFVLEPATGGPRRWRARPYHSTANRRDLARRRIICLAPEEQNEEQQVEPPPFGDQSANTPRFVEVIAAFGKHPLRLGDSGQQFDPAHTPEV